MNLRSCSPPQEIMTAHTQRYVGVVSGDAVRAHEPLRSACLADKGHEVAVC